MSLLIWALVLLLAGCIFLVLEFFIPSSGTLGVLAALSFVAAIVLAFMAGPVYGTATFVAVLIIVPTACILAVKYWPETPIGRMMLIQRPESPDEVLPETEAYRGMQHLVGRQGVAKSLMMPGGVVEVGVVVPYKAQKWTLAPYLALNRNKPTPNFKGAPWANAEKAAMPRVKAVKRRTMGFMRNL